MANITLLCMPVLVQADSSLLGQLILVEAEDGVGGPSYAHPFRVVPETDIDAAVDSVAKDVSAHLADGVTMKDGATRQFPPMSDAAIGRVKEAARKAWTPDVIAAWDAIRAQAQSELAADELARSTEEKQARAANTKAREAAKTELRAMLNEILAEQKGK